VSGIDADAGVHARDDGTFALLLAGRDTGVRLDSGDVVETLVEVAGRFVQIRGNAWRINELDDHSALLEGLTAGAPAGATWPPTMTPPVGWIEQRDDNVALGAAVPLGVLQARVAQFLAAIETPLVITPWRSVLVCDVPEGVADTALRVLAPLGLVFDEDSPWLRISACTGSPGCAKSAADVRADATEAANAPTQADSADPRQETHRHFVGCERACGSPSAGEVLVATEDGYRLRITPP
jgi:precorrin-3B synthase